MNEKKINSKKMKIKNFDSRQNHDNSGLFGLPFSKEESEVIIIPVPWDVTASFHKGAANGPSAIKKTSFQIDLYDSVGKDAWKAGIFMEQISKYWLKKNDELGPVAEKCVHYIEAGGKTTDKKAAGLLKKINFTCNELNKWVKEESLGLLKQEKMVGILGGDHSVPLGLMQALGEKYEKYSILHIDAHADYRPSFEGLEFSHASIQYNAGKLACVEKQVLLGVRDYSEQEDDFISKSKNKILNFTDRIIKNNAYKGVAWEKQCHDICENLGENVYISFDIDALNPALCPNTGTPVPSGLEYEQVFFLLDVLIKKGKKIIGFDLCEVAPGKAKDNSIDAIVGAYALYRLSLAMIRSQGQQNI